MHPPETRVVGLNLFFTSTCALTEDGKLHCWGENRFGEFGNGTYEGSSDPVPAAEGDAYCWHSGLEAQPVPGGYLFAGIAGGNGRFCGYTPGGSALCWHWSVKAVADTTIVALTTPEPVPSLADRDK